VARRLRSLLLSGFFLLSACQTTPPEPLAPLAVRPVGEAWRSVALAEDRDRFARLDLAWSEALGNARLRGFRNRVAALGPLLAPDAALPRAAIPPGPYRCRLIRFAPPARGPAFAAHRPFFCYVGVEEALLSFTKQDGSERPGGYLWDDSDTRLIFLGAFAIGNEPAPPAYGEIANRNLAGIVERIGPFRYRLVIPWPRGGATLDVLELVPVVQESD